MKASVVIVLAVVALLIATAVGGCSKKKPKTMDEVREKDARYWKDRWARKQGEEDAAGAKEPAAPGPTVGRDRSNASPVQVAPEGGSSPGMTEADEEAEADRDMPGAYE